jgi:hypothetical protein
MDKERCFIAKVVRVRKIDAVVIYGKRSFVTLKGGRSASVGGLPRPGCQAIDLTLRMAGDQPREHVLEIVWNSGDSALIDTSPPMPHALGLWPAWRVSWSPASRTMSPSVAMAAPRRFSATTTTPCTATCCSSIARRRAGGVGLGADARSRTPDPGAVGRGWSARGAFPDPSALRRAHPWAREAHRAFLAGAVRLRGDGRGAPGGGGLHAQDWRCSSVHAHLGLVADDAITATAPVIERFPYLAERIAAGEDEAMSARLRRAERIGRPVGGAAFIAGLERQTGRSLAPAPPGPKPKERRDERLAS